uniref:Uncharacterized protein n=1 Tax=viral metagenome TaxID=1070528 RepID=A0A6C0BQU8_9ZZZZ
MERAMWVKWWSEDFKSKDLSPTQRQAMNLQFQKFMDVFFKYRQGHFNLLPFQFVYQKLTYALGLPYTGPSASIVFQPQLWDKIASECNWVDRLPCQWCQK